MSPQGQHFGDGDEASLGDGYVCVVFVTNVPVPKVTPKVTLPRVKR